ncbi:hypothetical protein [Chitinophaga ginsengisegetis]|uniref:hypothetical protein n=1 Tax=Chitinophaga ginsengisegetis TaxID=393003 RepID=UPI000DBA0EB7|nr:hypothetical protein [Chitinophaga ginsengisegetis]MDR6570745.1 tetratricopeptide (TPR) repeat protein [Chitinophaga ginsengisegetis]MDR6650479.1 tetratricopeptide (TPR) repeat protein [Chitinophaga ginsengisegetis]MDR6656882.1 tetratricopeptide (TPR) repeat protein [Chitinophaga ginsengisegetis]
MAKYILLGAAIMLLLAQYKAYSQVAPAIQPLNDTIPADSNFLFSCGFVSSQLEDECIPDMQPSLSADGFTPAKVILKIQQLLGVDSDNQVAANFILYECSFPGPVFKAVMTRGDSTRYILYNRGYLNKLVAQNTDWVAFAIFAHEVGHHFLGHSVRNQALTYALSRQRELTADFFSGYIIKKLDGTLKNAESGIMAVDNHPPPELEAGCSHPTKAKRLLAIAKGYDFVNQPGASLSSFLNIDSLVRAEGIEQLLNRTNQLYQQQKFQQALDQIDKLFDRVSSNQLPMMFNNRGQIKLKLNQEISALEDFNKAIMINNKHAEFFENRGRLKTQLANEINIKEAKKDLDRAKLLKQQQRVQ